MDVFPELLGELEFKFFSPETYEALKGVLDDTLSKDIKDYMENPEADPEVVDCMEQFLGPTLTSMTMHFVLQEKGIIDLIHGLVPETLPSTKVDLDDLIEKLSFLEQNSDKLMTSIPKRNRAAWETFLNSMHGVVSRMREAGVNTTYSNLIARLEANKGVFYVPNGTSHGTKCSAVSMRRRQWLLSLRGAEFMQYCNEHGVNYKDRRRF